MKLQIEFENDIQLVTLISEPVLEIVININPEETIII